MEHKSREAAGITELPQDENTTCCSSNEMAESPAAEESKEATTLAVFPPHDVRLSDPLG